MTRQCSKCGDTKDESEFHRRPDGKFRGRQCKKCVSAACVARASQDKAKSNARVLAWRAENQEKHAATTKRWRDKNPDTCRKTYFWANFRIQDIDELIASQSGLCAACQLSLGGSGRSPDSICVDHDRRCCPGRRSCGKCVRGVLHHNCNLALGYAKDDFHVLRSAISYLEKWQAVQGKR